MKARPMDRHLDQDELERFLPRLRAEGSSAPGAEMREHVDGCQRCRRELQALRRLDERLADLPAHDPSPGFLEAVMARVELPVPWYRKAWAAVVERWVLVVASLAGAGASAGLAAWWVASRPEVTFGGLAGFLLERASALFWSALVGLGQRIWATGLPAAFRELVESVEPLEAALAMAVLSLCAVAAGGVMARLLDADPPRIATSR